MYAYAKFIRKFVVRRNLNQIINFDTLQTHPDDLQKSYFFFFEQTSTFTRYSQNTINGTIQKYTENANFIDLFISQIFYYFFTNIN